MKMTKQQQELADQIVKRYTPWLEKVAREEACMATDGFYIDDSFDEDALEPESIANQIESAYRKGYVHGYAAALKSTEGVRASRLWKAAAQFMNGKLWAWRTRYDEGLTPPPLLNER